jgi:RNA polymerase sigma-70 factor (ECF subfamily)
MDSNSEAPGDAPRLAEATAMGQFIAGRRPQLLAYIRKHLGTALSQKVEADDVLQEVSLEALRRAGELADTDRDPFGWLCQIAEFRLIDIHRRYFGAQMRAAGREVGLDAPGNDTQRTPFLNLLVASITSASQAFSRDQKEMQLQHVLATLPDESREALRLRYVDGLPTKDIAERMGKSDGAVRVLLTRSLNKLQTLMGTDETTSSDSAL